MIYDTKVINIQNLNGWVIRDRKDSNTGNRRAMKILYKNGKEVEHHWINVEQAKKLREDYEKAKMEYLELGKKLIRDQNNVELRKKYVKAKNLYHTLGKNVKNIKIGETIG